MSAANEINNNRGRTGSYSDVTYEDDGFFSDVPGSGSLSRSLLALNVYVKNNLLFNEDGSNEIEDVAYFSKESSPNKSIVKYDVDSSSNGEQNSKISQETRGQIKSTSVFSSKVLSEPVKHEYNINTQTDDYKSIRLQDFQIASDLNCTSDHDPEENSIPNSTTVTENDPETDKRHSRTVTNTVVRIEYSDIRQNDASSNNSFVVSPRECNGGMLSNVVTKAITLITQNGDENVENKHNDARGDYKSIKPLENDDCLSFDKGNDRIYTNLDYNYVNDLNKEKQKNKSFEYEENDTEKQNSQEDAQMLFKSKSYDNLEFKNEEETNTMVVQRHKPFSLKKQDNRHTLHEFSEWGNRTTTYPDVYAPLPYKSPRRYVESDVNIHYRCPVRHDPLPLVPERELARQQAEHMKRLYREQKRNKYLQELQDMQNRRHQDNFTPSQKTVVPLNRYDDADKVLAKALYTFNGQTSRELSFRKGDIIFVRRQIDANWYEGEIHGRIGLFPYNYVEIQKGDTIQVIKKPSIVEGRARAKFDFIAQTNLELPLKKGEVVTLTRRIDQNWWEGRNGLKTGIFPDSYVTILQEPSQSKPDPRPMLNTDKPAASPAAHGLLNGSDKRSMGSHSYTPQQNNPALANAPPSTQPLPGYVAKPAQATLTPSERGYGPPTGSGVDLNNTEPLYVDTNAEAIPYRAMYKYRPQNPDELELNEGDTVYVLEKCDDGWYVGSSQRTGRFGTFPGNYVERI